MVRSKELEEINREHEAVEKQRNHYYDQLDECKERIGKWETRLAIETQPETRAQLVSTIGGLEQRRFDIQDRIQECTARRDEIGAKYQAQEKFDQQRAQAPQPVRQEQGQAAHTREWWQDDADRQAESPASEQEHELDPQRSR